MTFKTTIPCPVCGHCDDMMKINQSYMDLLAKNKELEAKIATIRLLAVETKEKNMNTLDWKKLEKFIEERKPVSVDAGILNDWFLTAATVYENGEWKDKDRAYVTSSWATPGFKAEMENGDVIEVVAMTEETEEQAGGASELKGVVIPPEIGGWRSEAGNICTEDGYGVVLTLPNGGYMTLPPEMGRRILKALTSV